MHVLFPAFLRSSAREFTTETFGGNPPTKELPFFLDSRNEDLCLLRARVGLSARVMTAESKLFIPKR
jgi:hypothetical protein